MFVLTAPLACNDFTTTQSPAPLPPGALPGLYPSFCSSYLLNSQQYSAMIVSSGYGAITVSQLRPVDNAVSSATLKYATSLLQLCFDSRLLRYCSSRPGANGAFVAMHALRSSPSCRTQAHAQRTAALTPSSTPSQKYKPQAQPAPHILFSPAHPRPAFQRCNPRCSKATTSPSSSMATQATCRPDSPRDNPTTCAFMQAHHSQSQASRMDRF